MGYVSIQTVCSVLRADLYRAWTWLYMFGRVLKGPLVFGTAKRITLPLELFSMIIGLIWAD